MCFATHPLLLKIKQMINEDLIGRVVFIHHCEGVGHTIWILFSDLWGASARMLKFFWHISFVNSGAFLFASILNGFIKGYAVPLFENIMSQYQQACLST